MIKQQKHLIYTLLTVFLGILYSLDFLPIIYLKNKFKKFNINLVYHLKMWKIKPLYLHIMWVLIVCLDPQT